MSATDRVAGKRPSGGPRLRPCRLARHGDSFALALLLLFGLVFYRQLTVGGRTPVSFDALAYFYPNLEYLGTSLREGRLPLWNPYLFAGAPFLANSQTGVLYPPNWLAALLPAPLAYSWLATLHAALAAVGAYVFGRRALDLGSPGAAATALVFAFGGFFGSQVGHLNQLQAAAWLPLLLLAGDCLVRRPGPRPAMLGGLALCLQLLAGHSQVTYLSLWALALYVAVLGAARLLDARRTGGTERATATWLASRLGWMALLALVGVGLAAAQLLPTYELSRQSIRAGGLPLDEALSFSLPPWKVLLGLLPTFGAATVFSEWTGYVGVSGLVLAGLAISLRQDRRTLAMLVLVGAGLALAFGRFDPLAVRAYRWVPGLDFFRVPARWLLLYSFGLAGLAGLGLDALAARRAGIREAIGPARRTVLLRLAGLIGATALALGLYQVVQRGYPLELPGAGAIAAWAVVGLAALALAAHGLHDRVAAVSPLAEGSADGKGPGGALGEGLGSRGLRIDPALLLPLLLAGELLAAGASLDLSRANPVDTVTESVPEVDFLQGRPGLYRVLGVSENTFEIGRAQLFRDRVADRLSPEGIYDYFVGMKYKKTMTPNLPLAAGIATLDGYDGGVLPLRRYVELKSLFPVEGEEVPDGRLWLQLRTAPDPRLLGWLNVRYLVMDRARDLWLDGLYHDLAMPRTAAPSEPLALEDLPPLRSAWLGLVSHLEGADAPVGAEVAALVVQGDDGQSHRFPLRAGVETDEGKPGAGATTTLRAVAPWLRDPDGREYAAKLVLSGPTTPRRISVEYVWPRGKLVVRALSQAGVEPGQERVVDLSPDLKLVYLGDAKIYEHRNVLPRAFVVGRVRLAPTDAAALESLRSPDFAPRDEAVIVATDWAAAEGAPPEPGQSAPVRVAEYRPERVVVEADLAAPGLLVLTDADYPGWRALVDGHEAPIVRANYLFRGVWLPAGPHRVEFVFAPASLWLGLAISGAAALAAIGAAAGGLPRRKP